MIKIVAYLLGLWLLTACVSKPEPTLMTACEEPRPEMCTMHYDPVCASTDSGVRCVTTPCESTVQKTYGNACSACSDLSVMEYRAGACDVLQL